MSYLIPLPLVTSSGTALNFEGNLLRSADETTSMTLANSTGRVTFNEKIVLTSNNGVLDGNGNEQMLFVAVGSAVNFVRITNAATGSGPVVEAAGTDSNIDLDLKASGTGDVSIGRGSFSQTGLHIYGGSSGGNYVGFKASASISGNTEYVLPTADGSANQVLATNGSAELSWVSNATSPFSFSNQTSSFTAATGVIYLVDTSGGAVTVTLPALAGVSDGDRIIIKDSGSAGTNAITVDGNAAETIDGAATVSLASNYLGIQLVADASAGWFII